MKLVLELLLTLWSTYTACGFPLISSQSHSRRQSQVVFYCQHFGTGVLIATAFVHLLPTAFMSLNDPCLPYFFSEGYRPLPGLIAMVAVLVVVSIESYLTTRGAGHSHSHHHTVWDDEDAGDVAPEIVQGHKRQGSLAARRGSRPEDIALGRLGDSSEATGLMDAVSPAPESTPRLQVNGNGTTNGRTRTPLGKNFADRDDEDEDEDDNDRESLDLELNMDELADPLTRTETRTDPPPIPMAPGSAHTPTPDEQKRLLLQCLLLEAGILFHSVFIGMAISVATGPPFVVFLVAIAFHQTFEGLALGSRIAALHFPRASPRPWLMVLAYGTTTPLGQAIGLVVHKFYDPQSQTGLLMVGFMNAVSSGLLLFAGLVQLLSEDFLTEKSYRTLKGKKRVNAFVAVASGAALMAAVGAFA